MKMKEPPKITFKHFSLIFIFSVVALLPSYFSGIPTGPDQVQHYQSAAVVYESLLSGEVYPSIAGEIDHGFGYYRLRFYPPLTYYVLAIVNIVVRDWFFTLLISLTLAFLIGGLGIYLWAREEFGSPQALFAAAIYIFAPYHLNQIYGSFLLAEFAAMSILPFCFLFVSRVCKSGRWTDVGGLAVAFALLILTHLPLTIIGSVAMGIYGLVLLRRTVLFSTLTKLLTAVLLSVAMTAFYWARMLPELAWINHSLPKQFSGVFDYRVNFLMVPTRLLDPQNDVQSLWFADLMLLAIVAILLPSLIFLIRKRRNISRPIFAIVAVLAFSIFMSTPLSSFIWNNVSILQKVQFPWRWLAIISLFGAVLAPIGIMRSAEVLKNTKNILIPAGLGFVCLIFVFSAVFVTRGAIYISRAETNAQFASASTSDGCDCWWPIWVEPSAFEQSQKVNVNDRKITIINWSSTQKRFRVEEGEPGSASIAAFYYPRWDAYINGTEAPVTTTVDGVLSVVIPSEACEVQLIFKELRYVEFSVIISIVIWSFLFLLILGGRVWPIKK